jgi:flagellar hook protein FlgE
MGIFDALNTAVAGLQAQSFALQNISGNIANSQTTATRKPTLTSRIWCPRLRSGSRPRTESRLAHVPPTRCRGRSRARRFRPTWPSTATGWFVVAKPTGTSDNQPVFSGVDNYTRAGDFQLNSGGYLVNGAGYYLMGIPINRTTGNPIGSSPQVLQFSNDFVPAQETTAITYQLNLPSTPKSGMLNGSDFEANPLAGASPAATIVGSGAKLTADAVASGTGSVSTSTSATLASLGINSGDQITINDGVNSVFTYTSTGSDTVANLISAINAAHTGNTLNVSAALSGGSTGNLVLTGTNGTASITVGGTATADSAIGFGAGANSFQPVNLLTQGAVAPGDTLTVNVNGTPTTITFGTAQAKWPRLRNCRARSEPSAASPQR